MGLIGAIFVANEDSDGIGEVNVSILAVNPEAQAVDTQVVLKQLADSIGIAWVGERSLEKRLQIKTVLVKLHPDVLQACLMEEANQFCRRQGAHMGRVTQPFHAIECLGLLQAARENIHHDHAPT